MGYSALCCTIMSCTVLSNTYCLTNQIHLLHNQCLAPPHRPTPTPPFNHSFSFSPSLGMIFFLSSYVEHLISVINLFGLF